MVYAEYFKCIPKEIADNVNEGVKALHTNNAGGRIRIRTDSRYVLIRAEMPDNVVFPHMPYTGMLGFDLYVDGE